MMTRNMEDLRRSMTAGGLICGRNSVIDLCAYAGLYLVLDWISFIHVLPPTGFSLWNPPPACSLALLLLRGRSYAPALIVVSFVSDGLVAGFPGGVASAFVSDTMIAFGYTVIAAMLRRLCRPDQGLQNTTNVAWFLLVTILGVLVIAGLVSATFVLMHVIPPTQFASAVIHFWIGDLTGIIGMLPALICVQAVRHRWNELMPSQRFIDIMVFMASLTSAIFLVFGTFGYARSHLFYVLLLPVVWIAVRHGLPWSAIAVLVTQLALIFTTSLFGYSTNEFLAFQLLSLTVSATGLLVGAAVTERQHAEFNLRQQQAELERMTRLTTAGALGMAVAHQISQPLATIATYTHACRQLLRLGSVDTTVLAETMAKAEAEVLRAGTIVDRLRDFLSNGHRRLSRLDLAEVTRGTVAALTDNARRRGVNIQVYAPSTSLVTVDQIQIEQVLVNLIRNAIDATADDGCPEKHVRIGLRNIDDEVEVIVEDNGPGVSPELAKHLFEPFETSKCGGMGLVHLAGSPNLLEHLMPLRACLSWSSGTALP